MIQNSKDIQRNTKQYKVIQSNTKKYEVKKSNTNLLQNSKAIQMFASLLAKPPIL